MTAILDTSFLFALTEQSDRNHQRVLTAAPSVNEPLVLPVVILPESATQSRQDWDIKQCGVLCLALCQQSIEG